MSDRFEEFKEQCIEQGNMNPEKPDSENFSSPDDFIENKAEPFIQEVSSLISSELE